MATVTVTGRHDLTDAQWAVLALLPVGRRPGRPPTWTKRQLIDGIRWRVRVGAPWRDVPERYGSWAAAYAVFRRWQRDGTWQRLLTTLQALADAPGGSAGTSVWIPRSVGRTSTPPAPGKGGTCKPNHPAASTTSRPIMGWVALGAG